MKINDQNLSNNNINSIFSEDMIFRIPYYQRNYSWETDNINQLLLDIKTLADPETRKYKKKHFLGIVISKQNGGKLDVIDGQQRIATIVVIANALIKFADKENYNLDDNKNRRDNLKEIIYCKQRNAKPTIKLQLENDTKDNDALKQILNPKLKITNKDNLLHNTNRKVTEFLKKNIVTIKDFKDFCDAFLDLQMINMILYEGDDNPQNVFESINSKGENLSNADKIKNFIFMRIFDEEMQSELYKTYWIKIEKFLKASPNKIQNFFRDYVTIKTKEYIPSPSQKLYNHFSKNFYNSFVDDKAENSLEEIQKFLFIYVSCNYKYEEVEKFLSDTDGWEIFKNMNKIVSKTYLLGLEAASVGVIYFANLYYEKKITKSIFEEIVNVLNIYTVRWQFRSARGHLNIHYLKIINFFEFLMTNPDFPDYRYREELKDFIKLENLDKKNFYEDNKLKLLDSDQGSYAEDNELKFLFNSSTNADLNTYIIKEIEKTKNKENFSKMDTIEHVWPINSIDNIWPYNPTKKQFCKKIGNLALMEKEFNQSAGDKNFSNKKLFYENSKSYTLENIKNFTEWTEKTIDKNAEKLFDDFKRIFRF